MVGHGQARVRLHSPQLTDVARARAGTIPPTADGIYVGQYFYQMATTAAPVAVR